MAYRGGGGAAPEQEAERSDGLVEELVQQFADPLAFYRELIQNSIDARSTAIAVTLAWEPGADGAGLLLVSVRDDGTGMSREVLENQLMVLFRSGKEGREGNIGRFGVGFVSVLAVKPSVVAVQTTEGRGEQWTLHVHPDYSYDLFRASGGGSSGTTVTLHVPMPRAELDAFVAGSQRALTSWCAHVELPIRFVAYVLGDAAPLAEARIDRPFGLDDVLVAVEASADEGRTRVVAGLPRDGKPLLAFYNRGLLLHRASPESLGAVAIKILDARLEHTLSRDDVRRDAHHDRAMRFARTVVDEMLTAKVRALFDDVAHGRAGVPLDRLVIASTSAGLRIALRELPLPLLHPLGTAKTLRARDMDPERTFVAGAPSALTEAAAASGAIVLDLRAAESAAAYQSWLASLTQRALQPIEAELTLASPEDASPSDGALLDALARVLRHAARAPSSIALVRLQGAMASALSVAGAEALPAVLTREQARRDPLRLVLRPPLWLNVRSSIVAAARRAATRDPRAAGALLARAVLLEHTELDFAGDDAWLAASAKELT
jgi:molecular chaperone HtpG